MSYYNKCPVCGANLDPGEACNCEEQRSFEKTSKDKPKAWRCDCENDGNKKGTCESESFNRCKCPKGQNHNNFIILR